MYPQPHFYFTTLPTLHSQQPHSSNTLPFSFPRPTVHPLLSDQSLHPPGTEPFGVSGLYPSNLAGYGYGAQMADCEDLSTAVASQNWVVKQAEPIRYAPSLEPIQESSVASTSLHSSGNLTYAPLASDTTAILPHQTKVNNPMQCEVCKIDCNSKDVFEKHLSGKKHKKNLQLLTNTTNTILSSGTSHASLESQMSSIQGQVLFGAVGKELESKKRKLLSGGAAADSVKVCTICNIVCNSEDVFSKHLYGKKHAAQVSLMSHDGVGPYVAAFRSHGIGPWKKAPKKIKVVQPAWCEVCKISCNSRDVYTSHLSGKKHLKNLEKLSISKTDTVGSTTAAMLIDNATHNATNPIIGPLEKPDTDGHQGIVPHELHKAVTSDAPEKDLETKKQKLVESGAAAADVRFCTLCNVVCNSQTVFNSHLVGQKHAAMVKKQAESKGSTTGC